MSLAAAAFHIVFFLNLDNLKKHLLRLVEIELSVKFSPPFANTFSVRGNSSICASIIAILSAVISVCFSISVTFTPFEARCPKISFRDLFREVFL